MTGIVFFFEDNDIDVYSGRQIDLNAYVLATGLSGDIDSIIVINKTDVKLDTPNANINFKVLKELPTLKNAVYLDTVRGESIYNIDHSKVDWYVVGPANGWGKNEIKNYVYLPQAGTGYCHSQHILTTVMFNRYHFMKGNS